MKRLIATGASLAVAAIASLSIAGPATAADETATVGLTMTSQTGKLFTKEKQPVNWRTEVQVKAPASSSQVLPLKQVTVSYPNDMTFSPSSKTPVCPDSQIAADKNLSFPPDVIIARCPTAVIGNGTAGLYLAQGNSPNGPTLKDPVLIIFNGGKNSQGQAVLKIYGYSAQTGAGIFMEGALVNGKLDVNIPYLSFDSAVGEFNLNIPGSNVAEANRRGVDKTYVQATCSTGTWLTDATFQLGTRSSDGSPISPTSTIVAPQASTTCNSDGTGNVGGAGKFAKPKVKGPAKAKKGKKVTYKVILKNTGKKTIKNVKVSARGKGAKGAAKAGKLAAGKKKTVKVKVKFSKKGKIKTKFRATGKGASAKTAVKTVKVK